ncbi:MAG TPA: response regulator, partial [bacterium]|nr:response regulator [bacterium]
MKEEAIPRILVVDDEPDVRRLISEVLRRNHYHVDQAGNGKTALELFRTHPHELVITDIRMPGMDGFELMQKIHEISPSTEIIVMTGHVSRESVVRALDLGAYTYFVKPFECLDVIPLLTLKTLEHRRLLRENERLIDMLRRYLSEKQKELITFEEIADGLSQLKNHMELVGLLLKRVSRELQACGVWAWSIRETRLFPLYFMGRPAGNVETETPVSLGSGAVGRAAETGRLQNIDDLRTGAEDAWEKNALAEGVRSMCAVPLMIDNQVAGVLCACFTETDSGGLRRIESMQGFSKKMALVLKMIRMYRELVMQNEQLEKARDLLLQTEQLSAQGRL